MDNLNFSRDLGVYRQRMANDQSRISDFTARPFIIQGQFLVAGAGELVKDIPFPVLFTQKPLMTFGGDMDENETILAGEFPTLSCIVLRYDKIAANSQSDWYRGASIIVVTTGQAEQKLWVHWEFKGMALVNPVTATATTDDTI